MSARRALTAICAAATVAACAAAAAVRRLPPVFEHGWARALDAQAIDYGYSVLTDEQAVFVASHYSVVSLEKCTGPGPTEAAVWATAAQLKALNPSIRILFYWATDQQGLACYSSFSTLLANPSWWLRDDAGRLINSSATTPRIDWTVAAARAWWVSVPLNGTGSPAAGLIDGVLADGTGSRCPSPNIAAARCAALIAAKSDMVRALQALFNETNGGSVIGNGLDMYPGGPPDNNMFTIKDMNGIMGEHFAVFESVQANNTLNANLVAAFMSRVGEAAAAGKTVIVCTWPGLYTTPFAADGWPSWPGNSQPTTTAGWTAAMLAKHGFALAAFLTVAEANVWQTYIGWYNGLTQGAIACPEAPASCTAPPGWYPDLYKPLGAPLGPATRAGNTFTRHFAHATSVLNLDVPSASGVTFF